MLFPKLMKLMVTAAAAITLGSAGAQAVPVNMNGNLQNGVVFGSGNANGSFTGVNQNGVELGLRGKLRYDLGGNPQNTFNYDGDRTYRFDPALSNPPVDRAIWNFEFSIDVGDTLDGTLANSGYTFLLGVDTDPTSGTSFIGGGSGFNPLLYGDNSGAPSVAQNSQNIGFGFYGVLNPQLLGTYTINLLANNGVNFLSTSIDVIVGPSPVPLPAALPLLGSGLAAMGFFGWRRRRKST